MNAILFAINILLPNLLLMAIGFFMQKNDKINQGFIDVASQLVFNYCLPCLLFFSVIKADVNYLERMNLIIAGGICTFVLFFGSELYAKFFVPKIEDKGVFVQGVFRSNMAIMSLSIVGNAYGEVGLGVGAIYVGTITILYNILAVITLSRTSVKTQGDVAINMTKKILSNPLIIALLSAFIYKGLNLPMLPDFVSKMGALLGAVALPLALICAGATLNLKTMLNWSGISMQASIGRIVVAPILAVVVGLMMNLSALNMGVLFLMVASPAAAASYVMAKAMGGNEELAANILGFTTIVSMIGMAIGMATLRSFGLV